MPVRRLFLRFADVSAAVVPIDPAAAIALTEAPEHYKPNQVSACKLVATNEPGVFELRLNVSTCRKSYSLDQAAVLRFFDRYSPRVVPEPAKRPKVPQRLPSEVAAELYNRGLQAVREAARARGAPDALGDIGPDDVCVIDDDAPRAAVSAPVSLEIPDRRAEQPNERAADPVPDAPKAPRHSDGGRHDWPEAEPRKNEPAAQQIEPPAVVAREPAPEPRGQALPQPLEREDSHEPLAAQQVDAAHLAHESMDEKADGSGDDDGEPYEKPHTRPANVRQLALRDLAAVDEGADDLESHPSPENSRNERESAREGDKRRADDRPEPHFSLGVRLGGTLALSVVNAAVLRWLWR